MTEVENVSLSNLSSGVADELFSRELEKVLDNIADINTSHSKAREITLKLVIKPNMQRDSGDISIKVTSKIAPAMEHSAPIYFSKQQGKRLAFQAKKPQDSTLFDNVSDIKKEAKAGK
jgi:hypothetical protein